MTKAEDAEDRSAQVRLWVGLIGLTVVVVMLSVAAITPKLVPWKDNPFVYETTKVPVMLEQLASPADWDKERLNDPMFDGAQSIRWRLLPPVVGNVLSLSPGFYLTLPWLALPWMIFLCCKYSLERKASVLQAGAIGILVGTSSAFFSASGAIGYFDPFYIIALLMVCFSPSRIVFTAACVLGPWIDEKFLLMLPACVLARYDWSPSIKWFVIAGAAISPYCLIRFAALFLGDSSFDRQFSMQGEVFWSYAPALPEGWWYGFRLGWLPILLGIFVCHRELGPKFGPIFTFMLLAAIGSISFLAWDTTRSIAMVMPLMLLGLKVEKIRKYLPALAAANLLLPAAYVWAGNPVTVPLGNVFSRF